MVEAWRRRHVGMAPWDGGWWLGWAAARCCNIIIPNVDIYQVLCPRWYRLIITIEYRPSSPVTAAAGLVGQSEMTFVADPRDCVYATQPTSVLLLAQKHDRRGFYLVLDDFRPTFGASTGISISGNTRLFYEQGNS